MVLLDRSRAGATTAHPRPQQRGDSSRLPCAIPSESWKHLARAETGVGRPLEKKRSFSASLLPSQHTLVRGGATGSLLQTLSACATEPSSLSWHFHLLQSFQLFRGGELGSVHSAWVGKQSPLALKH